MQDNTRSGSGCPAACWLAPAGGAACGGAINTSADVPSLLSVSLMDRGFHGGLKPPLPGLTRRFSNGQGPGSWCLPLVADVMPRDDTVTMNRTHPSFLL